MNMCCWPSSTTTRREGLGAWEVVLPWDRHPGIGGCMKHRLSQARLKANLAAP